MPGFSCFLREGEEIFHTYSDAAGCGPGSLYLAPRCATLCKIAMGFTMGYMLILVL